MIVGVHFQNLNGRPSGGCLAGDVDSLPCEMIFPPLLARMKEGGDSARERVNAGEVGAFAQIAVYAREAEVEFVIGAAVLARADVLDVEGGERRVILMQAALLAAVRGPLAHEGARRRGHSAASDFMALASRRRVATNLLART